MKQLLCLPLQHNLIFSFLIYSVLVKSSIFYFLRKLGLTLDLCFVFFFFIVVVQSLIRVRLFVTWWTAAHQGFLSFTISRSLLKLMSIDLVMQSNHHILYHPFLLLPSIFLRIKVLSNECQLFTLGDQSIGTSASVLPMNIQGWFPFGLTGLIFLLTKGLSRVFSNTTV